MATTRRQFIKRGFGAVTASFLVPHLDFTRKVLAQEAEANLARKLVVIQFAGGNDGLNTVIPYTDSNYYAYRPNIAFKDTELVDDVGATTMIDGRFGFHPRLKEIRDLYNSGKVAVILGVGEEGQSTSHFEGTTNIASGRIDGKMPDGGWLGRYAKQAFGTQQGLLAAAIGGSLPQMFYSDYVIPSISSFEQFTFRTDSRYVGDRNNQVSVFSSANARQFPPGSFIESLASTGSDAYKDATTIQTETAKYNPTGYPTTGLGNALSMVSKLFVTIPTTSLAHVAIGGFDNHQDLVALVQGKRDKLNGGHAGLLMQFSQAVKAFYNDLAAHGISQNTLIMTYSEFGRRPKENGTFGNDHGRASVWFVIGDGVHGGLLGDQPSIAPTALDRTGNPAQTVDLRSIYAEILDKWFNHDSKSVLGASFPSIGLL